MITNPTRLPTALPGNDDDDDDEEEEERKANIQSQSVKLSIFIQ
jgi:hypothetical protein